MSDQMAVPMSTERETLVAEAVKVNAEMLGETMSLETLLEWAQKHQQRNTNFDADQFAAVVKLVTSLRAKSDLLATITNNYITAENEISRVLSLLASEGEQVKALEAELVEARFTAKVEADGLTEMRADRDTLAERVKALEAQR